MVALTAINSATPMLQAVLGRSKLQQARREAEQAEATAQNLRQQANAAEQEVQKSQAKVRAIAAQNGKNSDVTYTAQRSTSPEFPSNTQESLVSLYRATSPKQVQDGNALQSEPAANLVRNFQGQATGRIVNVTA